MSQLSIKTEFIASACNRTAQSLDWSDGQIAFGSGNHIGVYDPQLSKDWSHRDHGIKEMLRGHTKRVNCVGYVRGASISMLVSGSADCTARLWAHTDNQWQCRAVMSGHKNPIISVTGLQLSSGEILVVTASTDGTLKAFECGENVECRQTIDVGSRNALAVTAREFGGKVLLVTGNTDHCVHVYASRARGTTFVKCLRLQGHEDWVTSVDILEHRQQMEANAAVGHWQKGDLVVASGSQDKYIRLWRITPSDQQEMSAQDMLDRLTLKQLSTKSHQMAIGSSRYAVSLDSVLLGHDGWVHSVQWSGSTLVSASADGSVILWHPDPDAGVWSSRARLGETGSGFLGAAMGAGGRAVVAHGLQGSFHMWTHGDGGRGGDGWRPRPAVSGHFGSTQDVCWDPQGSCLLSVAADQTARLFGCVRETGRWMEVARPQVHGYDLRCAAFVNSHTYVSGADEKVLRVFKATRQFVNTYERLTGNRLDGEGELAVGASLPVLGLSNKAVGQEQVQALVQRAGEEGRLNDSYQLRQTHTDVVATAALANAQPTEADLLEEHLQTRSLWPEVDKLYGHPYEIFAVAGSHAGDLVATACRATSERFAAIRLYSTKDWLQQETLLVAHSLTVTRLRFSHDDRYLLSVSRDRSWTVFEKTPKGYGILRRWQKAHARILWDAAWAPPGSEFFATASRDKTVKLWTVGGAKPPVTLSFPEPVVSVDFMPSSRFVLAVQLEGGRLFILKSKGSAIPPTEWQPMEVPPQHTSGGSSSRISWRPPPATGGQQLLALGSDDLCVRIISVKIN